MAENISILDNVTSTTAKVLNINADVTVRATAGISLNLPAGLIMIVTNSFLVGLYCKHSRLRKYIPVTLLTVFIAALIQGVGSLFRVLMFVSWIKPEITDGSMTLCIISISMPDFTYFLVILLMPLVATERFFRVAKPHIDEGTRKKGLGIGIATVCLLSALITVLPYTGAYSEPPSFGLCKGLATRNPYISIAYAICGFISCVVPTTLYIRMLMIGKQSLRRGSLSARRHEIMRRASLVTMAVSMLYILTSLPLAIGHPLYYACESKAIDAAWCIRYRKMQVNPALATFHKLGYIIAPLAFSLLHPKLRKQIKHFCTSCSQDIVVSTTQSSGSQAMKNSSSEGHRSSEFCSGNSENNSHPPNYKDLDMIEEEQPPAVMMMTSGSERKKNKESVIYEVNDEGISPSISRASMEVCPSEGAISGASQHYNLESYL